MGITVAKLDSSKNPFDSWQSLALSLYMTLAGYGSVGVPVISSAWVNLLGFSEVQVGRVAGADLGGLSVGAVATSLIISRISRRQLILIGILIAVLSNAACISITSYEYVLWLRFLAGFGSGLITATAVSCLGACSKPALAFNAMLFAFAFSQAAEMHFLPMLSMQNIYLTFIICFLVIIPFIRSIPDLKGKEIMELPANQDNNTSGGATNAVPNYVVWFCLSAIVITYVNIGAYWTYMNWLLRKIHCQIGWVVS